MYVYLQNKYIQTYIHTYIALKLCNIEIILQKKIKISKHQYEYNTHNVNYNIYIYKFQIFKIKIFHWALFLRALSNVAFPSNRPFSGTVQESGEHCKLAHRQTVR